MMPVLFFVVLVFFCGWKTAALATIIWAAFMRLCYQGQIVRLEKVLDDLADVAATPISAPGTE